MCKGALFVTWAFWIEETVHKLSTEPEGVMGHRADFSHGHAVLVNHHTHSTHASVPLWPEAHLLHQPNGIRVITIAIFTHIILPRSREGIEQFQVHQEVSDNCNRIVNNLG